MLITFEPRTELTSLLGVCPTMLITFEPRTVLSSLMSLSHDRNQISYTHYEI